MRPVVQFVSYDSPEDVGGVSTWLRETVPWLRGQGIDARVDLFCFEGKPGANAEWYRKEGVPFRWSPWQHDTKRAVQQCLRWLSEEMPQVYVPNCILPAYFAAAEAKRCGARTIGVLHSDDPFYWGVVDEFLLGRAQWRLDEVVVVSRFLRDALQNSAFLTATVHEIPYGVTISEACAVRPAGKVRMVYTGRLVEEQKRISELVRAFCRVVRENPGLEAWIVGSGPDEASVRSIIQAAGMVEKVILKGRIDNEFIYEVLKECHLFVLLSDYEGTPVSLLEAMSVGLVPICLETRSGVSEVISNMKNGILVSDREVSFSAAVSHLLKYPEARSEFSSAARRTILERYSNEICRDRWKALLLANPPAVLPSRRPKLWLRLPPQNPKFGHYDQRPSPVKKSNWHGLRIALGAYRRKMLKLVRGAPKE
jgi:glycosyltransferase involved in cell wall biosynthesis